MHAYVIPTIYTFSISTSERYRFTFLHETLYPQVRSWRNGGWTRVHWRFAEPPSNRAVKILRRRVFSIDPKASADSLSDPNIPSFSQHTVQIKSRQVFAALDSEGRTVAGDEQRAMDVHDVWVVEKVMGKTVKGNRWRLIKRYSAEELEAAGLN